MHGFVGHQNNGLEVSHFGGDHAGKIVFIPRITLEPSSENLPIDLTHCQFPVYLAFVMTINKAQGQSIINIGIDLPTAVFSHGYESLNANLRLVLLTQTLK